jgi:hypothetical protein
MDVSKSRMKQQSKTTGKIYMENMPKTENLSVSPVRISTMTITANWMTGIHLTQLFEQLKEYIVPICYPTEGILKYEHGGKSIGASYKDLFTRKKITSKSFFNQSTIILRRSIDKEHNTWKEMNVKLFANGGIQMTGIPSEEFAKNGIQWLFDFFKSLPVSPFKEPEKACISKFNTPLINTDFCINGYDIHQENIHKIFINDYNIMSMLEKTIYQGVNAKYFLNKTNTKRGICTCDSFCKGQGNGNGEGECKRITMSIFRTGKIIITGARSMDQIRETYEFLTDVIKTHSPEILVSQT